ncbi:MAG: CRP-like cAMP-binding protein [Candidatus Azotimanducaceae bacterium]|jgi:CRP-like cAMP-binding protein
MEKQELDIIHRLSPFDEMEDQTRADLLAKASIITMPAGKILFKRGDAPEDIYWLLTGTLDLLDESFEARIRDATDDASRFPIDNHNPHQLTAITTLASTLLVMKADTKGLEQPAKPKDDVIQPAKDGADWMSTLLSSPLFEFIPPANIQSLFGKFEKVRYAEGEAVIRQGETGDYYYVLQSGRAKVERTSGTNTTRLAEFEVGDNFGQDALITSIARNATVTMLTSGTLMRLSKPDFESLLMEPVIETVSLKETQEMIKLGVPKTYLLDVRNPKELESGKLENSQNLPLLMLRKNLGKLKQDAIYITTCDNGNRSTLASYILNENGFTAFVLAN